MIKKKNPQSESKNIQQVSFQQLFTKLSNLFPTNRIGLNEKNKRLQQSKIQTEMQDEIPKQIEQQSKTKGQKKQGKNAEKQIEQSIKKLEKTFYRVLNSDKVWANSERDNKSSQQNKNENIGNSNKQQSNKLEKQQRVFIKVVQLLCCQAYQNDRWVCLQWLLPMLKINTNRVKPVKGQQKEQQKQQQSIYSLTQQASTDLVIALPYGPELPPSTQNASANIQDDAVKSSNQQKYYKQDEQLLTCYFDSPFLIARRDSVATFVDEVVKQVATYVAAFVGLSFNNQPKEIPVALINCLQTKQYSFQTFVKTSQLLQQITVPIYTYSLINIFKGIIQKISQFLQIQAAENTKLNIPVSAQKINKLIYSLSNICIRWESSASYNKNWQWDLKQKIITGLIDSSVSQTKLTAVKMLSQMCKKLQYSIMKPQQLEKFIQKNGLLQKIFSVDSHPDIISKSKQIYQFLSREQTISQSQLKILLSLLPKSHQNTNKSLYVILQSLGQTNLTHHSNTILSAIEQLPRASLFIQQTVQLLQTLMVVSSSVSIKTNLNVVGGILGRFYTQLRKTIRERLVRLYFEGFVLGVEEGSFISFQNQEEKHKSDMMQQGQQNLHNKQQRAYVIKPIADNLGTNYSALMLDTFIRIVKNQSGKNISMECKKILQQSIQLLFTKYKIHKHPILESATPLSKAKVQIKSLSSLKQQLANNPNFYSKQCHLQLIKYLLQSYLAYFPQQQQGIEGIEKPQMVKQKLPLSYQQMCQLIQHNMMFIKFIGYYDDKQQIQGMDMLIHHKPTDNKSSKTDQHLANIMQLYTLIKQSSKESIFDKIYSWFMCLQYNQAQNQQQLQVQQKIKIAQFIINNAQRYAKSNEKYNVSLENVLKSISHCGNQLKIHAEKYSNVDKQAVQHKICSLIILLKQHLKKVDKKGYGQFLPYTYLTSSSNSGPSSFQLLTTTIHGSSCSQVLVKVTNALDVLDPKTYQMQAWPYESLSQVVYRILIKEGLKISMVNFKIKDNFVGVQQFGQKVGDLATIGNPGNNRNGDDNAKYSHMLPITITPIHQSQYFQKSQLLSSSNKLQPQIQAALCELFFKNSQMSRMHRNNTVHLFRIATQNPQITEQDSRIQHIYSHYSENGEFLTLEEWINFYQKSALRNPGLVTDNIKKLGYAHLFKSEQQIMGELSRFGQGNVWRQFIIRQTIKQQNQSGHSVYDALFLIYNTSILNKLCIQLLEEMPVDPKYLQSLPEQNQNLQQLTQSSNIQGLEQKNENKMKSEDDQIRKQRLHIKVDQLKVRGRVQQICSQINISKKTINMRQMLYLIRLLSVEETDVSKLIPKIIILHNTVLHSIIQQLQMSINAQVSTEIDIIVIIVQILKQFYHAKQLFSFVGVISLLHGPNFKQDNSSNMRQLGNIDWIQDPISVSSFNQYKDSSSNIQPSPKLLEISYPQIRQLTKLLLGTQATSSSTAIWSLLDNLLMLSLLNPSSCICINNANKDQSQSHLFQFMFHSNQNIRVIFNNYYYLLCEVQENIKSVYYSVGLDDIPNQENSKMAKQAKGNQYDMYFQVLNKLLRLQTSQNEESIYSKMSRNIQTSIKQFIDANYSQASGEQQMDQQPSSNYPQSLLSANLSLLSSLTLFYPAMHSPVSAVKSESSPLNNLLCTLMAHPHPRSTSSLLYKICNKLLPYEMCLKIINEVMDNLIIHKNSNSRKDKKMGLMNLGCICYINSAIQMLYMVKQFKDGIISVQSNAKDQNNLYFDEFQYLIYQLQFGKREFFVPQQFCLNYKDSEGNPVNIKQQHDADEFLNTLFDKLQHTLAPSPMKQLVKHTFSGQMASIITCQTCHSPKIRIQPFYILTLQIKNHKTLHECFQKLTQPEIITDYYCQKCKQKVQIIEKCTRIRKLSKYLIIHLQRLVFDLQTLSKIKLQHLVQYPEQLDLSQFFIDENIQDQNSTMENEDEQHEGKGRYKLKGFIVHIGTSQSGHYYSLVKQNGKWIKFDDSRIDDWQWNSNSRQRQCTYIIVYERMEYQQLSNNDASSALSQRVGNQAHYSKIMKDNKNMLRENIFLQPNFPSLILDTLTRVEIPPELLINSCPNQLNQPYHPEADFYTAKMPQRQKTILREAHDAVLGYLGLVKDIKNVGANASDYNSLDIKKATSYYLMLLHVHPSLLQPSINRLIPIQSIQSSKISTFFLRTMLTNSDKTIRQAYKLIFTKILSILVFLCERQDNSGYFIPAPAGSTRFYVQKILEFLLSGLQDAGKNSSKCQEYFQFIDLAMDMSQNVCKWFRQQGLGPKLIHFLCNDESSLKGQLPSYNFSSKKPEMQLLLVAPKILYNLLKQPNQQKNDWCHPITKNALLLTLQEWLPKLHGSGYYFYYINLIVQLLLCPNGEASAEQKKQNMLLTLKIGQYLLQKMNRAAHSDQYIIAYVDLIQKLIQVSNSTHNSNKDLSSWQKQCQLFRCQLLLGVPMMQIDVKSVDISSRFYKYSTNNISSKDQIIMPLLQILYTNRLSTNYLTISGIRMLLALCLKSQAVFLYICALPGPVANRKKQSNSNNYYFDWINQTIKNLLNPDNKSANKQVINQIAWMLSLIQQKIMDEKYQDNGQYQKQCQQQTMKMQQSETVQIIPKSMDNKIQKYYNISGQLKQFSQHTGESTQYFTKIHAVVSKLDRNGLKGKQNQTQQKQFEQAEYILRMEIKLGQNVSKCLIKFKQDNYRYQFVVSISDFSAFIPYPDCDEGIQGWKQDCSQLVHVQLLEKCIGLVLPNVQNDIIEAQAQIKQTDCQQFKRDQVESGNFIQCPFCTSISKSWSTSCPTCGEDWGQMM